MHTSTIAVYTHTHTHTLQQFTHQHTHSFINSSPFSSYFHFTHTRTHRDTSTHTTHTHTHTHPPTQKHTHTPTGCIFLSLYTDECACINHHVYECFIHNQNFSRMQLSV